MEDGRIVSVVSTRDFYGEEKAEEERRQAGRATKLRT
jgi:hypothetical protein